MYGPVMIDFIYNNSSFIYSTLLTQILITKIVRINSL